MHEMSAGQPHLNPSSPAWCYVLRNMGMEIYDSMKHIHDTNLEVKSDSLLLPRDAGMMNQSLEKAARGMVKGDE